METPASQFFTRQRANEGIEVPLVRPDGVATEHKVWIRGIDSDAFRSAVSKQRRQWSDIAAEKGKDAINFIDEADGRLDLLASLVFKWTFPETCTSDAVKNFLREAPQIADAIDKLSSRRTFFFKPTLTDSTNLPEPSSSSANP